MRLLATVVLAAIAIQEAAACSVVYEPKVAFDPEVIIFEGRVIRVETDSSVYVEDWLASGDEQARDYARGAALIVEPIAVVNAPAEAERFAVYPAELGAACERIYSTAEQLEQAYPVGERVLVVATGHDAPSGLRASAVPLVVWLQTDLLSRVSPLETFSITTEPWPATVSNDAEESRAPELLLQEIAEGYNPWRMPTGYGASEEERVVLAAAARPALEGRRFYEYERDLALLHAARSNDERIGLLFKVRWYRFNNGVGGAIEDCAYADLVRRHLPSEQSRDRLGAYLLLWGLRPLPPYSACEEVERIQGAERQGIRLGPAD